MKAERRHELQENTLAHVLQNLPLYASVYGGRVLTGILIVALIVILFRYRSQSKISQMDATRVNLASAREAMYGLERQANAFAPPIQQAQQRAEILASANSALDAVLSNADTDALKAEALVSRGDLYWTIANLPELPGAATQPVLQLPEPRSSLLDKAKGAYEQALAQFPKETVPRGTAMLGLGAVAENQGDWDAARRAYEAVKSSDLPTMYKALAEQRLALIPLISKPRRLVAATMPATQPTATPSSVAAPTNEQPTTKPGG